MAACYADLGQRHRAQPRSSPPPMAEPAAGPRSCVCASGKPRAWRRPSRATFEPERQLERPTITSPPTRRGPAALTDHLALGFDHVDVAGVHAVEHAVPRKQSHHRRPAGIIGIETRRPPIGWSITTTAPPAASTGRSQPVGSRPIRSRLARGCRARNREPACRRPRRCRDRREPRSSPQQFAGGRSLEPARQAEVERWRARCAAGADGAEHAPGVEAGLPAERTRPGVPGPSGKVLDHGALARQVFGTVQAKCGIVNDAGRPKYGPHAFRHFTASWLIETKVWAEADHGHHGPCRHPDDLFNVYGHLFKLNEGSRQAGSRRAGAGRPMIVGRDRPGTGRRRRRGRDRPSDRRPAGSDPTIPAGRP